MKKFITTSLIAFWALAISAQGIYTRVKKYDKFDDVIYEKTIKTLVTKTDDKIIFETKGSKPVEYCYFDSRLFAAHIGSRDSLVNLVNDIYGYEDRYNVFPTDTMEVVRNIYEQTTNVSDSLFIVLQALELIHRVDNVPEVVFRTISKTSYSFMYDTDLVWIRFKDGSRIVYSKH